MNKYVIISLVCLAIAFGGILSQNGQANLITYASVVPGVLWVGILLVKAFAGWLADRQAAKNKTLNSFALPLLFLVNFHLSGWWLLAGVIALVWLWAGTRESGSFGISGGLAVIAALIFTVAIIIGGGTVALLK